MGRPVDAAVRGERLWTLSVAWLWDSHIRCPCVVGCSWLRSIVKILRRDGACKEPQVPSLLRMTWLGGRDPSNRASNLRCSGERTRAVLRYTG